MRLGIPRTIEWPFNGDELFQIAYVEPTPAPKEKPRWGGAFVSLREGSCERRGYHQACRRVPPANMLISQTNATTAAMMNNQ